MSALRLRSAALRPPRAAKLRYIIATRLRLNDVRKILGTTFP